MLIHMHLQKLVDSYALKLHVKTIYTQILCELAMPYVHMHISLYNAQDM
jgi:hypothetical protein